MAIKKLVFCLASMIILTGHAASSLPQGFLPFGWISGPQVIGPRQLPTGYHPAAARAKPFAIDTPPIPATPTLSNNQSRLPTESSTPLPTQDKTRESTTISANTTELTNTPGSNTAMVVKIPMRAATRPSKPVPVSRTETSEFDNFLEGFDVSKLVPVGIAAVGAVMGRDGCALQAACLAGNLFPLPEGRGGLMMMFLEPLVPSEWKTVFQVAKSSMTERSSDCNRFSCF